MPKSKLRRYERWRKWDPITAADSLQEDRNRHQKAYRKWRIEAYRINPNYVTEDLPKEPLYDKARRQKRWGWLKCKKYLLKRYHKGTLPYRVQIPYWLHKEHE